MSRHCQLTGAVPGFGRSISHSHVRTPRRFNINVQNKRIFVPSLGRTVKLRLSAKGIKVLDLIGPDAAVARILSRGGKI
ncbi:MAG: 50S ribosomal protein L28 [Nakamurella sp.]